MRKFIVLFMAWFFLGQLSLESFNAMDTDKFMNAVGQAFSQQNECSSEIVAMTNGEIVMIYGRCQELKETPKEIPEVDPDKIVG